MSAVALTLKERLLDIMLRNEFGDQRLDRRRHCDSIDEIVAESSPGLALCRIDSYSC
jgi:hypothetical protein